MSGSTEELPTDENDTMEGEGEDEFGDFDAADDEEQFNEIVEGGGFGELQGLLRRSKRGNVIATDAILDAPEDLQFKAFREVTRSFLIDERNETAITPAMLMERSIETEPADLVAQRAEKIWAKEFEALSTKTEDDQPSATGDWTTSFAHHFLKSFYAVAVDTVTPEPKVAQSKLDPSWVHKEEAEIAKALNGALSKDKKRNKILQKLGQLGERLTPEDAAEMARARLAAAEAAAALAGDNASEIEAFTQSKPGFPRSYEREEVALREFVKLDPDECIEQMGLFEQKLPAGPEDGANVKQEPNKTVTISEG
uniref:Uncharacterized protein n=1 Tax=Rhodosorus marinus TaxID=101924 RepID=A0A7S3A753_9RHOD|mmetsp:Transcript_489/g.854  ORF Transcript_489/g.854 Transcript_489/m.854 type:complete len:311 (+) Transcript_489:155-1087(+)|eukprot:CAMPEP_0113959484 /NCGR_PEP_ID=MMETSP0011_2-20120614/4170_1 /TAXON_ID=101924 /ORGANISM="Rhodosorus marinus" /LENGTH=310 /DNA_ID=CAMNT_0000970801 /DNA_START=59 /DNA_END=991 /DNA_ORIENTATION=- /assembly_acc=CAM_ASM_000156